MLDTRTNLCFRSRFCGGRLPFYPCHIATGCQSVLPAANSSGVIRPIPLQ